MDQARPLPRPGRAAIAALHISEVGLDDILGLTTDSVAIAADGSVTVTGGSSNTVILSGTPAQFVKAAVAWRLFAAGPGPLFSTRRAESISDKRLGHLARMPMEIGIRHTGTKAYRAEPTATRWLANYGVEIQRSTKAKKR